MGRSVVQILGRIVVSTGGSCLRHSMPIGCNPQLLGKEKVEVSQVGQKDKPWLVMATWFGFSETTSVENHLLFRQCFNLLTLGISYFSHH